LIDFEMVGLVTERIAQVHQERGALLLQGSAIPALGRHTGPDPPTTH
jgi:hypothetical protein